MSLYHPRKEWNDVRDRDLPKAPSLSKPGMKWKKKQKGKLL